MRRYKHVLPDTQQGWGRGIRHRDLREQPADPPIPNLHPSGGRQPPPSSGPDPPQASPSPQGAARGRRGCRQPGALRPSPPSAGGTRDPPVAAEPSSRLPAAGRGKAPAPGDTHRGAGSRHPKKTRRGKGVSVFKRYTHF